METIPICWNATRWTFPGPGEKIELREEGGKFIAIYRIREAFGWGCEARREFESAADRDRYIEEHPKLCFVAGHCEVEPTRPHWEK